jgi:NAD(P)-dependent dehydrogenase (short-subunit alcohol dehydrogenase family)
MAMVDGKAGLITGAGRGIGRASALLLAREGARVLVADIHADSVQETAQLIREAGGIAEAFVCDVGNEESVAAMVAAAVAAFGGLDFAHNNAATHSLVAPLPEHPKSEWDRIIAINLTSVFLCMKYEIPAMLKRGGGSIINMSSAAGLVGVSGMPAYVASKHGVAGITKEAALDYARQGLRVNAIAPGWVETPMVTMALGDDVAVRESAMDAQPVGRFAAADEIAEAVVWLASDRSSYTTGSVMAIDGGYTAR